MDITELLAFTHQNGASDLHLSPLNQPIVRIDGELKRIDGPELEADDIRKMLYSIMSEENRAVYESEKEIDFAVAFDKNTRYRVNAFTGRNGASAVFRTIPSRVPTLDELDPPEVIKKLTGLEKGIVLVTGPTGSGKSTTLAAIIDHINTNYSKHILTIEDPVEFFHNSKKSLVNHREVGNDTKSFSKALRSALREDPDVILVGEMRDYETISLALTAAETGHLVFGTLHSSSASKTIDRIIDVFPSAEKEMVRAMLSSSLQAVIAQTLLKRADGKGRIAAHEILVGTNAVRNLIRENQIAQMYSMIQVGIRHGMQTMEDTVRALLDAEIITEEEAARVLLKSADDGIKGNEHASANTGEAQPKSRVQVSSASKDPARMERSGSAGHGASSSSGTSSTGPKGPGESAGDQEGYSF